MLCSPTPIPTLKKTILHSVNANTAYLTPNLITLDNPLFCLNLSQQSYLEPNRILIEGGLALCAHTQNLFQQQNTTINVKLLAYC